ncbi:MAG: hypothetical protein AAB840_00685 [Patescibacteria group bacterium]
MKVLMLLIMAGIVVALYRSIAPHSTMSETACSDEDGFKYDDETIKHMNDSV